jgi:hypothetical protein
MYKAVPPIGEIPEMTQMTPPTLSIATENHGDITIMILAEPRIDIWGILYIFDKPPSNKDSTLRDYKPSSMSPSLL